jgi:hypothetical protein
MVNGADAGRKSSGKTTKPEENQGSNGASN